MSRVRVKRLALGAGALFAIYVTTLLLVRPVPDAVVSLLGGPAGFDRVGGVRVRYRPPPDIDAAELARSATGWCGGTATRSCSSCRVSRGR